MNGYVSKLFDVDSLTIPNEMLETNVDEQRIDDEITQLSRRYADEMPADIVANDDVVYCIADEKSYPDKRTIILYPGADMPGAGGRSRHRRQNTRLQIHRPTRGKTGQPEDNKYHPPHSRRSKRRAHQEDGHRGRGHA